MYVRTYKSKHVYTTLQLIYRSLQLSTWWICNRPFFIWLIYSSSTYMVDEFPPRIYKYSIYVPRTVWHKGKWKKKKNYKSLCVQSVYIHKYIGEGYGSFWCCSRVLGYMYFPQQHPLMSILHVVLSYICTFCRIS